MLQMTDCYIIDHTEGLVARGLVDSASEEDIKENVDAK